MPTKTTPAQALAKWGERKDSDMTPSSVSFRMPMWLFRMAVRCARPLQMDELADTLRAVLYVGAAHIESGGVQQITDDITSAASGSSIRGAGPRRVAGGNPPVALSASSVLRDTPLDTLLEEVARRAPNLIVEDRAEMAGRVASMLEREAEKIRKNGLPPATGG